MSVYRDMCKMLDEDLETMLLKDMTVRFKISDSFN